MDELKKKIERDKLLADTSSQSEDSDISSEELESDDDEEDEEDNDNVVQVDSGSDDEKCKILF